MVAWLGMIASVILVLLVRLGIVPSSSFSENLVYVGLVWMALCWAIALADRINRLKAETEDAYHGIRSSEHRLSQILEGMPLGVALYGTDQKPRYINQRTVELLSSPAQDLKPDVSAGRTLEEAIQAFSLKTAGSETTIETFRFSALRVARRQAISKWTRETNVSPWKSENPVRDERGCQICRGRLPGYYPAQEQRPS
jgi:PAS domain-containing protein